MPRHCGNPRGGNCQQLMTSPPPALTSPLPRPASGAPAAGTAGAIPFGGGMERGGCGTGHTAVVATGLGCHVPQRGPPCGCLAPCSAVTQAWCLLGAAFIKKHKTKLCSRMGRVSPILLHLRDAKVINSDEEEEVRVQSTSQRKNQVLLELVEKKGLEAQEQLYRILRTKDEYLITDLEKSS